MSVNRLAVSITTHAWSPDGNRVAICPNDTTLQIFVKQSDGSFQLEFTLKGHDAVVTCVDWYQRGSSQGEILSCSQDRNAFVWRYDEKEKKWNPTLVILRLNRAATKCRWSPNGQKFAVASGDKVVSVCHFDVDNDWWVSKLVTGHNSTILDISWHPNNILLATACADNTVRVVSAYVKDIDDKASVANGTAFGKKLPFKAMLKEIPLGGWAHAVAWSPSGNRLAFVSHDAAVHVLECPTESHSQQDIFTQYLPFTDLVWLTEESFVAVGHDCLPILFSNQGGKWTQVGNLDKKPATAKGPQSNLSKFQSMDQNASASVEVTLDSRHQNCITTVLSLRNKKGFSTSGLDGNVVVWDTDATTKESGHKVL